MKHVSLVSLLVFALISNGFAYVRTSLETPMILDTNKCRYDLDKYDKFQKTRKIEKTVKAVKTFYRGNGYLDIKLCNYGNNTFFRASTASLSPMVVGPSDELIFLLQDGQTVKAVPDAVYSSDYNGARYLFQGTYNMDPGDLIKLRGIPVTSVRLYYNQVYKDFEIKKALAKDLQDAFKCF